MSSQQAVVPPLADPAPRRQAAWGWRGILLPAGIVLTIGTIFVAVYLSAFHNPQPRHLPIAVVGSAQQAGEVTAALTAAGPDGYEVHTYADRGVAERAVQDRTVYAAYVPASTELLYAGANGPSLTAALTGVFGHLSPGLKAEDVRPSSSGDTRGLSIFYAAFGLVLAGFLFGTTTYAAAPGLLLRQRLVSLGLFGVAGGVIITLITGSTGFNALPGSFAGIAGIFALTGIAIGAATMALIQVAGPLGTPLASVILLVLGNATSTGILPAAFLPVWLHPLSAVLPVGAGVHALQGLAYFGNDGLLPGLAVLICWIAVAVTALLVHDRRRAARRSIQA